MKHPSFLAVLGLALLAPPATADDIFLLDGRDVLGVRIQKESYSKVEYKRKSVTQKVDASEIRSITYGRTSPEFSNAMKLRDGGDMGGAANYFLYAADEDEDLPDFVRATALVEAGDALLANNNVPEALDVFTRFLVEFDNSRHLARALLGRGRALFMSMKATDADAALNHLKSEVAAKNLGDRWTLEADFLLLWSAEFQGKPGVVDGYRELRARARGAHQGIANKCSLRMGRVLLGEKKVRDAQPLFEEIIDSRLTTDADIVAGAFNGRGRCLFSEAQGWLDVARKSASERKNDAAQEARHNALESFRAARLDFLRVQTVYKGVFREQPESLYWGGQAFLNVADLDKEEEDAERNGKILLKRCREQFGGSEWGKKAAAER